MYIMYIIPLIVYIQNISRHGMTGTTDPTDPTQSDLGHGAKGMPSGPRPSFPCLREGWSTIGSDLGAEKSQFNVYYDCKL